MVTVVEVEVDFTSSTFGTAFLVAGTFVVVEDVVVVEVLAGACWAMAVPARKTPKLKPQSAEMKGFLLIRILLHKPTGRGKSPDNPGMGDPNKKLNKIFVEKSN